MRDAVRVVELPAPGKPFLADHGIHVGHAGLHGAQDAGCFFTNDAPILGEDVERAVAGVAIHAVRAERDTVPAIPQAPAIALLRARRVFTHGTTSSVPAGSGPTWAGSRSKGPSSDFHSRAINVSRMSERPPARTRVSSVRRRSSTECTRGPNRDSR